MSFPKHIVIVLLFTLGFAACFWAVLPKVTPEQVTWAKSRWPDMDQARLTEARSTYVNLCSGCHGLAHPKEYSLAEWDVWISSMAPKAKLNSEQEQLIRRYVETVKSVEPSAANPN